LCKDRLYDNNTGLVCAVGHIAKVAMPYIEPGEEKLSYILTKCGDRMCTSHYSDFNDVAYIIAMLVIEQPTTRDIYEFNDENYLSPDMVRDYVNTHHRERVCNATSKDN
jgi:hypothetical protein